MNNKLGLEYLIIPQDGLYGCRLNKQWLLIDRLAEAMADRLELNEKITQLEKNIEKLNQTASYVNGF